MKTIKAGILGLGTVGCGTLAVLQRNADEIYRRTGCNIKITHVAVRDLNKTRDVDLSDITLTDDPFAVIEDDFVDIIIELIGGISPAHELVMASIELGKHVITANKALIATHGNKIFKAALNNGVIVAFEAAVAGGIPIIKAIRESLAGNNIQLLVGIINGTSNFILTEMRNRHSDFESAISSAQTLGYAEADYSFDINGTDAAHKLTIMASMAFGISLQFDKVYIEGIDKIGLKDIEYAAELGYRIKHLGIAKKTEKGIDLRVHPALVPESRLLANVDGVKNAIVVTGDAAGPTLYYGTGAGGEATASAVLADLIDVVRTMKYQAGDRVPYLAFQPQSLFDLPFVDIADTVTAYYLHLLVQDKPGVLAKITTILAQQEISIEAVIQKEPEQIGNPASVVLLTDEVHGYHVNQAIIEIENLEENMNPVICIRIETLN